MTFTTQKISEFPNPEIEKSWTSIWYPLERKIKDKNLKWFWIFWIYIIIGMVVGLLLLNWIFGWGLWGKIEQVQPRLPQAQDKIDSRLIWAIGKLETQNCQITVGRNNCYNIKNKYGRYADFESEREATAYLIHLLTTSHYYQDWRESGQLEDLGRVYAEDPNWVSKITKLLIN